MGLLGLALCCAVLVGCGARAQVSGKVLYEDGSPVSKGHIYAQTEDGKTAVYGLIKENGSYKLGDPTNPGTGVPAGKMYKVWIIPPEDAAAVDSGVTAKAAVKVSVHPDYTDMSKTPLTMEVPGGSAPFEHDVKVKKP